MCYTRRVTKINMKNGGMRMVKIKVVDAICGGGQDLWGNQYDKSSKRRG